MSIFEMVLSAACVLGVSSAWHVAVRRPEFGAWLDAWAKQLEDGSRNRMAQEWIDGYEAGKEYERLRGSKTPV